MESAARTDRIAVADLEAFCVGALRRCGVSETDARTAADVLVTADAMGVYTHGTKALRGYVKRIRAGGIRADAVPRVVSRGPAWAIVDGGSALGMVSSVFAMETAVETARAAGIAYVGVRNGCHFGPAGYYANLAAKADMIGLATANDTPSMAVPGSRGAVLGTNPFAYAVPAGEEDPICMDIASSAVAGGKVRIAQALKQRVPDTWLVDADGAPTTDPFVYPHHGSLMPFGGHKGYGFAALFETLSGLLAAGAARAQILSWIDDDPSRPTGHCAAFMTFDVGAITPIAEFKRRVDAMIRDIRQAPKAKGAERIYLPGEMEWERRRDALDRGVPLPDDVRASLRGLAGDLGLRVGWL
jgi:LDH2 family malate/lactate/ureidoglycolate dehydrogenase